MLPVYYYKDLTPRVRVRKSNMMVKSDYTALVRAENVQTILRKLETTPYKPYATQLLTEEFTPERVEDSLIRSYHVEVQFLLTQLTKKKAIDVFKGLNNLFEMEALSGVAKLILLNTAWESAAGTVLPHGKVDLGTSKSLVEGKNLKRVIQMIKDESLVREIERILQEAKDPTRQALDVELAIKSFGAVDLWKKLKALEGADVMALRMFGIWYDSLIIVSVLRMMKLGFKSSDMERSLPPVNFKVSRDDIKRAISAPSVKDAVKSFTSGYYVNVISPLLTAFEVSEDITLLEVAFRRFHAGECQRVFSQIFNLGEGVAYVYLKWYEIRDLIAIIVGKYLGMHAEEIERHLVLHQPPHPI